MGLFSKIQEKVTGMENVRITYDQMVDLVRIRFIEGADSEFLKKVKSTAKSVTFARYTISSLESKDQLRKLTVYPIIGSFMILLLGKHVSLTDREEKRVYTISSRKWKKFYKGVVKAIEAEKSTW